MAFHPSSIAKIAILVFLSGIATPSGNTALAAQIRCPLVWEPFEITQKPTPADSVPSIAGDEDNFVIRGRDPIDPINGPFRIGRLQGQTDKLVYIVGSDGSVSMSHDDLQILRNVHGCDISWLGRDTNPSSDFLTRADTDSEYVVGRAVIDKKLLIGEVNTKTKVLTAVDEYEVVKTTEVFEYLISTSDGIHLEFTNLTFQGVFNGAIEFLGIDEINNQSPAIISQAVTHTKEIIKASKFTHDRRWAHCSQATFNFEIDLKLEMGSISWNSLGLNIYQTFRAEKFISQTIGSEVEQTLTTTRTIEVKSYSHVQVCTLIGKISRFSNPFKAVGKYTAKGWTGKEVYDYLKKQPSPPTLKDPVADSDYAESIESGHFAGEMYLNNVMAVLDPTLEDGGCLKLEELVARWNSMQVERKRTGNVLIEEEKEIDAKIAQILAIKKKK